MCAGVESDVAEDTRSCTCVTSVSIGCRVCGFRVLGLGFSTYEIEVV